MYPDAKIELTEPALEVASESFAIADHHQLLTAAREVPRGDPEQVLGCHVIDPIGQCLIGVWREIERKQVANDIGRAIGSEACRRGSCSTAKGTRPRERSPAARGARTSPPT